MSDLISREQTIQAIDDYTKGKPLYEYPYQLIEVIRSVPSAEKTGKWIKKYHGNYSCSVCGAWYTTTDDYGTITDDEMRYNYCPNCGADMREEE